jgi:pyrimidine operon attenuation protein / uracil phosphoribosyltransferase
MLNAQALYIALRDQIAKAIASERRTPHLIGVHSGGAWIAQRLHADLKLTTPLGFLSSAFHRDDYSERGLPTQSKPTQLEFDVNQADLIVVDDILYTGRTVRAVMNELYDYGRAARIELAVLIDRGGRELPVAARFVGGAHQLPTDSSYSLSIDEHGQFALRVE